MIRRLGRGRDDATRARAVDLHYTAAETELREQIGDRPFIASLEVKEIDSRFGRKASSKIHDALTERPGE